MSKLVGFQGYAPGAIKTRAQLLDLIIEARKERKAIRLYAVVQSGRFEEVFLTSKSAISMQDSTGIESFTMFMRSSYGGSRYYRISRCLGDLNIVGKTRAGGHNRHQLFANRRLAEAYSTSLKSDTAYLAAVAERHASFDRIFGRLWS